MAGRQAPPPPHAGAHSRQQLSQRERLDHVVVCAQLQPIDLVLFLDPRGEDQDRDVGLGTQVTQYLESAQFGQHQVEHDQVQLRQLLPRQRQSGLPVSCREDPIALAQKVVVQGGEQSRIVLDDQDGCLLREGTAQSGGLQRAACRWSREETD